MRIVDADHNWKMRLLLLHVKWKQNKNSSFQGETLFTKPPAHGWVMLKSWVYFIHMSMSPKAHGKGQTTIRRLFEVLRRATMDYPHTSIHKCTLEKVIEGTVFSFTSAPVYTFPPFFLFSMSEWVRVIGKRKKERKKNSVGESEQRNILWVFFLF